MAQSRVLIVDDEVLVRDTLREILKRGGYEVVAVDGAAAALQEARKGFDLLLSDIKMPEMNGLELIEEFRKLCPEVVPLLITAYPSVETARSAVSQGAFNYITKPFDRGEILTAVADALERKRLAEKDSRLKELSGLYRVSQAVTTGKEQDELLDMILRVAIQQTKSSGGSILLFDPSGTGVSVAAAAGAWDRVAQIANAILGNDIDSLLAKTGEPLLFTDVENHPMLGRVFSSYPSPEMLDSRPKGQEILLLPIEMEGRTIGFLNICREAEDELIADGDMKLLRILSAQLAICLESRKQFNNLEDSFISTLVSVASEVDHKSPYTEGHMERVAILSVELGRRIGLGQQQMRGLELGARLHDIGNISLSEAMLNKPDTLSIQEWQMVKLHPIIGDELLAPLGFLDEARQVVRHHHERLDGKGYPDGLLGDEITPQVHIVVLADAYDAMTSPRPWRPAMEDDEVVQALLEEREVRFNPAITDAFLDMVKDDIWRSQWQLR